MIWNLQVSQKCKKLRKIRKGANHFHCTNLLKSVVLSVTIYVYFVTNTSLFRLSNKKHPCIEFSIFSFMLAKENFLNRKKILYVHFAEIKVECFTNNTCLYLVPDCLIRNECSLENWCIKQLCACQCSYTNSVKIDCVQEGYRRKTDNHSYSQFSIASIAEEFTERTHTGTERVCKLHTQLGNLNPGAFCCEATALIIAPPGGAVTKQL